MSRGDSCTPKQAGVLADFGYDPDKYTFDEASSLIDKIAANGWKPLNERGGRSSKPASRRSGSRAAGARGRSPARSSGRGRSPGAGSCTPRQAATLERNGYDPDKYTFDEASALIDRLAANNWEPLDDEDEDGYPVFGD